MHGILTPAAGRKNPTGNSGMVLVPRVLRLLRGREWSNDDLLDAFLRGVGLRLEGNIAIPGAVYTQAQMRLLPYFPFLNNKSYVASFKSHTEPCNIHLYLAVSNSHQAAHSLTHDFLPLDACRRSQPPCAHLPDALMDQSRTF
jgi:hypothetical protein